jgi:hypothetical protein
MEMPLPHQASLSPTGILPKMVCNKSLCLGAYPLAGA